MNLGRMSRTVEKEAVRANAVVFVPPRPPRSVSIDCLPIGVSKMNCGEPSTPSGALRTDRPSLSLTHPNSHHTHAWSRVGPVQNFASSPT